MYVLQRREAVMMNTPSTKKGRIFLYIFFIFALFEPFFLIRTTATAVPSFSYKKYVSNNGNILFTACSDDTRGVSGWSGSAQLTNEEPAK